MIVYDMRLASYNPRADAIYHDDFAHVVMIVVAPAVLSLITKCQLRRL